MSTQSLPTTMDPAREFIPLNIAVLTISDTRRLDDDISGSTLIELLTKAGHHLAERRLVRDEIESIRAHVKEWAMNKDIQVIITTGGTGFTGRDITPEAVEPLFDKKMEGFSTLFHLLSFQTIGSVTIQSRATAGLINMTLVFCLPGSRGACKDAWYGILQGQLDNRQRPGNFVELMERFGEI